MPIARAGDIEIAYEDHHFADDDPPLVLIAGLGSQLIFFEDEFVRGLMDRSFRVIRFDNRDAGLSTVFDDAVDLAEILDALAAGREITPPYTLSDMADDVAALLDHLQLDSAHVLGVSLGGMIAQVLALEHPHRVDSMTLLSSTTGSAEVGQPSPEALAQIMAPSTARTRDEVIEADVSARRVWATTQHFDEDLTRGYFGRTYDRAYNPMGVARQMAAVVCAPDREPALTSLTVPTLVLHGTDDSLIDRSGGARLAELIPDADYVELDGMGHDLPPHYWAPIIEAVTQLVIRSSQSTRA